MTETLHDAASFSAGQDCGTRVAACLVRVAALELVDGARWWNRRRRRRAAAALVACADELDRAADASGRRERPEQESAGRPVLVRDARPRDEAHRGEGPDGARWPAGTTTAGVHRRSSTPP